MASLTAVVLISSAAEAAAGTYVTHACHTPSGAAAPLDGWTGSDSGAWVHRFHDCGPTGAGAMWLELQRDVAHNGGDGAQWRFVAPTGTSIVYVEGFGESWAGPFRDYGVPHVRFDASSRNLWNCTRPWGCSYDNRQHAFSLPHDAWFSYGVHCTGQNGCASTSEVKGLTRMSRWSMTLDDPSDPAAQSVDGTIVEGSVRNGTDSLAVRATDSGSGVRHLRVHAGGRTTTHSFDTNGGRCAEPYVYVVPCKTEGASTVHVDTAQVPDGKHELSVELVDAAGNAATIYGPRTHTFDNRPPVVSGRPEVVGEAQVGKALECAEPAIDGQEPRISYAWHRAAPDGSSRQRISAATARTYTPVASDEGRKLICEVTAADAGGASQPVESSLTSGPFADGGTVRPAAQTAQPGGTGTPGGQGGTGGQAGAPGAPATVTVVGAGSTGWALDAFFTRGRSATAMARWGAAVELGGRVKDGGGGPVAGAVVEVLVRDLRGQERNLGTARTSADGGWALKVPARIASSRLTVRAKQADGALRAAADLSLRVGAGIALRVTPGRVRPKGLIRFRGRLLGGPFPAKGKVLELRARSRGTRRWIPFKTFRTDARGAFRTSYRLRRGFRNITYEFQVASREEPSYPYAAGTSRVRSVRVR